jgi:hypothetical protein
MSHYKVDFDFYTQQFDTTYPIFLQSSGVSPQEYAHAIGFVGEKLKALYQRRTTTQRVNAVVLIAAMVFGMACVGGSVAITLTTRIHALWTLFAISMIFVVVVPITSGIITNRKNAADTKNTYAEVQNDLVRINQNFNGRGVQLIFKVSHSVVGHGKHMSMLDIPSIEVITVSNVNGTPQPDTSYQPTYYQPINSTPVTSYQTQQPSQQYNPNYQGQVYQQQQGQGYGQMY